MYNSIENTVVKFVITFFIAEDEHRPDPITSDSIVEGYPQQIGNYCSDLVRVWVSSY